MSAFYQEEIMSTPYLVYQLEKQDEIDYTGLDMINTNHIPHVLGVSCNQRDSERYFMYNLTSLVSLTDYLQETMKKSSVLEILKGICTAYIISEEYLLDSKLFVLDMDHIYVDTRDHSVKMVYLAIEKEFNEINLANFFRMLITMVKADLSDDCTYIPMLLNTLNNNAVFSVLEFRNQLNQLDRASSSTKDNTPAANKITAETNPPITSVSAPVTPVSGGRPKLEKAAQELEDGLKRMTTTATTYLGKIEGKQESAPRGFEVPGRKKEKPAKAAPQPTEPKEENGSKNLLWLLRNFSGENLKLYREQNGGAKQIKKKKEPDFLRPGMTGREEMLSSDFGKTELDATVGLEDTSLEETIGLDEASGYYAYLYRENTKEQIPLNQEIFLIGRDPTKTNYCVNDNPAIGRRHAAIYRRGSQFYIVDMNSKNHTYLNGSPTPIVSNTEVELGNGMEIKLGNEVFFFTLK